MTNGDFEERAPAQSSDAATVQWRASARAAPWQLPPLVLVLLRAALGKMPSCLVRKVALPSRNFRAPWCADHCWRENNYKLRVIKTRPLASGWKSARLNSDVHKSWNSGRLSEASSSTSRPEVSALWRNYNYKLKRNYDNSLTFTLRASERACSPAERLRAPIATRCISLALPAQMATCCNCGIPISSPLAEPPSLDGQPDELCQ